MGSQHSQIGLAQDQNQKPENNGVTNEQKQDFNQGEVNDNDIQRAMQSNSSSNESLNFNHTNLNPSQPFSASYQLDNRTFSNSDSDCSLFGKKEGAKAETQDGVQQQPAQQQQVPKSDLINNVFTWNFGGEHVFLIGDFNQWKERIPMTKNGNEFTLIYPLERGVHQFKFIVDNEWRFAPDQPTIRDDHGNINNILDTTHMQQTTPQYEHVSSAPVLSRQKAEHERERTYGQQMPSAADLNADAQVMPIHFQYNFLRREEIPLHNEKYSKPNLEYKSNQGIKSFFDKELDLPSHVILNHVNTWRDCSETMNVISMTQRLNRNKFVTTIYYKPIEDDEMLYD